MNSARPLLRRWLPLCLLLFMAACLAVAPARAETIPAKPTRYFNDYALTVSPSVAEQLNTQLENLEKESTNQILVCIYPKLETDTDLADYCQRVYRQWGVGGKDKDRGAILFIFIADRKTHISTGRGLEGALPDATCQQILANEVKPRFKENDYDGGLTAGVDAMIQAAKGEYKGTGDTQYQRTHRRGGDSGGLGLGGIIFIVILFIIIASSFRRQQRGGRGGTMFGGGPGPIFIPMGGFGGGGGSSSSSSSSSSSDSGGGFFSSDGGDSGGGGASGDW